MASMKRDHSRRVLAVALVLLMLAALTGAIGREALAAALFAGFAGLAIAGRALSDSSGI